MAKKPKLPKTVRIEGYRIRLFQRDENGGASIYYSYQNSAGKRVTRSTKMTDAADAEAHVRAVFAVVLEKMRNGQTETGKPVTLGQVFRAYFEHEAPSLTAKWRQASDTRRELFEAAWGAGKAVRDIGQGDVKQFAQSRRVGTLRPSQSRVNTVREGTIESDLRWLSVCFRWAMGFRVNGRPLVQANPLAVLKRPKPKNVRRPVASHERYVETLKKADAVDPAGRLACMLALARYTGHREGAICQLQVNDFLRTKEEVRAALGALGFDERQADYYPHGGLRWRAAADKMGNDSVTPLAPDARSALDAYLAQSPRLGKAPLFPASTDPSRPIRADSASHWLMKAEKLAGLPSLSGGRWHPYRRLWATERRHLPAQDVAAAGGWTDTQALTTIYQHATPDKILEVVEVRA